MQSRSLLGTILGQTGVITKSIKTLYITMCSVFFVCFVLAEYLSAYSKLYVFTNEVWNGYGEYRTG